MKRVVCSALSMSFGLVVCLSFAAAGTVDKKPAKAITLGKDGKVTVKDKLTDDDAKIKIAEDSPVKMYDVKMLEGKKYTIDLESTDFDAVLILLDPKGNRLAVNDDVEKKVNLNSRIVYDIKKDGTYRILASSYDAKGGAFTLKITEGGGNLLKLGQKVTGKLAQDKKVIVYLVNLEEGKSYTIDMTSPDLQALDPLLILKDAKGKDLTFNDDISKDDLNSRIVFLAPATGTYQIGATSYMQAGVGEFNLIVRAKE